MRDLISLIKSNDDDSNQLFSKIREEFYTVMMSVSMSRQALSDSVAAPEAKRRNNNSDLQQSLIYTYD